MPLVRIDIQEGRDARKIREIADRIHNAIVRVYGIPSRD